MAPLSCRRAAVNPAVTKKLKPGLTLARHTVSRSSGPHRDGTNGVAMTLNALSNTAKAQPPGRKLALDQLRFALRNLKPNCWLMPIFAAIMAVMFARWIPVPSLIRVVGHRLCRRHSSRRGLLSFPEGGNPRNSGEHPLAADGRGFAISCSRSAGRRSVSSSGAPATISTTC